ncbi:TPR and ankyrin repeat-containing protein 1-like [Haliotis rufescens]|uniref:TPR and ankyrin repeat-containing protein 1-like n=1 Tax=Haliotis rufescens TaxID=6454 RepID=UPI00201F4203|nr:TPR and ankyrin repeat-containing protein 1-like [Haliotis rufescens]
MLQKIPSYHEQSTIISTYREVKVTGDADTRDVSGAEEMGDIPNFEGLAWEVECSSCVWKLFKHRPYYLKKKFILVIHKLALGQWDPPLRKVIKGVRSVEIYEAEFSKDARVIWKIGISRMKDTPLYTQVISILDIVFDHDNLRRAIDKVAEAHRKGQECQWTKTLKGIKHQQFLGKRSETYREPVLYKEEKQAIDASTSELTQLYPLVDGSETVFHIYRFHSFTTSMAKCIIQDNYTAQFPFKLNDEEHVIINSKPYEPILLLGRSGTGKTTCCLYRLWQNFCSQWNTGNETDELSLTKTDMLQTSIRENTERPSSPSCGQCGSKRPGHLHQIFVTKNHVLCAEIKKQFTELYHGQNNTMPHGSHNCGPLPSKLKVVTDVSFPLFLTSKQLLLMLDASLDPPHFFERNEDGSLRENIEGWKDEVDVLDDTVVDDHIRLNMQTIQDLLHLKYLKGKSGQKFLKRHV